MRFKEINDSQPKEWTITLNDYKTFNGIKIPTIGEVAWKLDNGDFTWYKLEVYDLEYNKSLRFN